MAEYTKPGVIKKLQEGRESAEHSRYLATIVTDAPLNFTPEDNLRRPFAPELYDLLLKLEFQKLIDRYGLTPHRDTEAAPEHTVTVEPLEVVASGGGIQQIGGQRRVKQIAVGGKLLFQ